MQRKILVIIFSLVPLFAINGGEIAKQYNIKPYTKAKIQWIRVFDKPIKMKKLGIYDLNDHEKKLLLSYCLENAADADNPTVPGLR